MIKLIIFTRKIHRIFVLIITVFSIIMAFSGIILKYPFISAKITFLDLGMIRYVHNQLSPFFTITLMIMLVTGLLIYLTPWLNKITKKN